MKVLVDLNVILDVLARRQPHYQASAQVWGAIESGEVEGLIAAHSVTTEHYLAFRHLDEKDANHVVQDILTDFSVTAVDQDVIQEANSLGWTDFEDAVQMAAAAQADAEYLISRNPKYFNDGLITLLQPEGSLPF